MDSVSITRQLNGGQKTDDGYEVARIGRVESHLRLKSLLPLCNVFCIVLVTL